MRLVVGLGNPGSDYAATRHNIGFMAADAIAARHGASPWKKKFNSLAADLAAEGVLLLKPQTFMNLSGEAVGEAARFYKIAPKDVIVFHDELDLLPGQVKIKLGGGNAGHNGLKSIDAHIGPDYWRVRIGIGRPGPTVEESGAVAVTRSAERSRQDKGEVVTNYVLGGFAKSDAAWVDSVLTALAADFPFAAEGNMTAYQERITKALGTLANG